MNELPVVQGLFVCDQVLTHPQSGRLTLVDRIASMRFRRFPSRPTDFCVFVTLRYGEVGLTLVIVHLESDAEVRRYRTVETYSDRLTTYPLVMRLDDVVFPEPGTYEITLFAESEPLTQARLRVLAREDGP